MKPKILLSILLCLFLIPIASATLSFTGNTFTPQCSPGTQTIRDFTIDEAGNLLYLLLSDGTLEIDNISTGSQVVKTCDSTTTGITAQQVIEYKNGLLLGNSHYYNITYPGGFPTLVDFGTPPYYFSPTYANFLGTINNNTLMFAGTYTLGCGNYEPRFTIFTVNPDQTITMRPNSQGLNYSSPKITTSGSSSSDRDPGYVFANDGTFALNHQGGRAYLGSYNTGNYAVTTQTSNWSCLGSPQTYRIVTNNTPELLLTRYQGTNTYSSVFSPLNKLQYDTTTKYMYVLGSSGAQKGIGLVDFSTPSNPQERGLCGQSTGYASNNLYVHNTTEAYAFINNATGIGAIRCEFSNPTNPTYTNETQITGYIRYYKQYLGSYNNKLYSAMSANSGTTTYSIRAITGFTGSSPAPGNASVCGNGITEVGESCDAGGSNGACPAICSNSCTVNVCTITTSQLLQTGRTSFGSNYTLQDISFDGVLSFITSHYADSTQSINYLETTDYTSSAFQAGNPIGPTFHSERIINSNTNYTDGNTYADNYVWTGSDNNFNRFINTQNYNTISLSGYDNFNNSNFVARDIQKVTNETYAACWWQPSTGGGALSLLNVSHPSSYNGQFELINYLPYAGTSTYDYCRQLIINNNTHMAYVLTRNKLTEYNISNNLITFHNSYTLASPSSTSHAAMTYDMGTGYFYIAEPLTGVEKVIIGAGLGTCDPTPTNLFDFQTGDSISGAQSVDLGRDGNVYITTNAQLINDFTNSGVRTLFTACNASTNWISGTNAYTSFSQTRQGFGTSSIIKSEALRFDNITNQFHIIDQMGNYATYRISTGTVSNVTNQTIGNGSLEVTLQDDQTLDYIDTATLTITANNAGSVGIPVVYTATGSPNLLTHTTTFLNVPTGVFITLSITATNSTGSFYDPYTANNIYLPSTTLVQTTSYLHMSSIPGHIGNTTGQLHLTFLDIDTGLPLPSVSVSLLGFLTYQDYSTLSDASGTIHLTSIIPDQYLVSIIPPSPFVPYAVSHTIHAGEVINYTINLSRESITPPGPVDENGTKIPNSYTTRGCTDFIKNTWLCGQENTTCTQNSDCLGGMCIKYAAAARCSDFNYNLCDRDKIARGGRCIITESFKGGMTGIANHLLTYFFFYALIIGITIYFIILFRKKGG
jgi:hypothetical protein